MGASDDEEIVTHAAESGAHERRLAVSAVAQQGSQVTGTLVMLVVVTAIARSMTLSEFGLYGLVISFSTYLLIAQTSVEGSAVKALGEATCQEHRDRAFSIALSLYLGLGIVAGFAVVIGGLALLPVLNVPHRLHDQATLGVVSVGAVMVLGWPMKVFQDVLRGTQRFVQAACAEVTGYLLFAASSGVLLVVGAPLWTLIAVGAALSPMIGAAALVIFVWQRAPHRFRRSLLGGRAVRSFAGLSGYLFLLGIADLVIYALDRAVLSAFRSPATVGLYEGPLRAHNLVRQVNGTLALIVLPVAAGYLAAGDDLRVRDLLLRGTRYVVAVVVPLTITLMLLAGPILRVWLGARYQLAEVAMVILMSYWLVASSTAVAAPMLVAAGQARLLVIYAGAMAVGNLALSLVLTPPLGLNGVVLGTAIPYALLSPAILMMACHSFPVSAADFARKVWLPVFSLALPLAVGLAVVRLTLPLNSLGALLVVLVGSLSAYWAGFYLIWLEPGEKLLISDLIGRRSPLAS